MKKYLLLALLAIGCTTTKIQTKYVYVERPAKPRLLSNIEEFGKFSEDDPLRSLFAMRLWMGLPDTIPSLRYKDSLFVLDENMDTYYIPKDTIIGVSL